MTTEAKTKNRNEEIKIRLYGETMSHARWQWEQMLEDLRPDTDAARRVREYLEGKWD